MRIPFPPRPASAIPPGFLNDYEKSGQWVVQRKFNGQHALAFISGRQVEVFNRNREPLNCAWTAGIRDQFLALNLDKNKDYWLNGEYLDRQTTTPQYKVKFILHDVLQAGRFFFGSPTLLERVDILKSICNNPTKLEPNAGIALFVSENIWMAQTFHDKFVEHYNEFLELPEIEGLMPKKKNSTLDQLGNKVWETNWLIRCRKPDKVKEF